MSLSSSHDSKTGQQQRRRSSKSPRRQRSRPVDLAVQDVAQGIEGEWVRPPSTANHWITQSGGPFPAEAGRYHLFVANNCPWCARVITARAVKQLEALVTMDVLWYRRDAQQGWQFNPQEPGCTRNTVTEHMYVPEIYKAAGVMDQRSVPLLYDKKTHTVVSNESAHILRMFNSAFDLLLPKPLQVIDLYPPALRSTIDGINEWVYQDINNGAYKAGFAASQSAYELAYTRFFAALDRCEALLAEQTFLAGDAVTEADIRLWPTLIRMDTCYYVRFKLNKKMIKDYANLSKWMARMWQLPGVRESTNIDHIKKGYFGRIPGTASIIPIGPRLQDLPYLRLPASVD